MIRLPLKLNGSSITKQVLINFLDRKHENDIDKNKSITALLRTFNCLSITAKRLQR